MSNSGMKTHCFSALSLLVISAHLFAAEHPAPPKLSSDFERMKSLVGSWKGKADMGQGMMEFTVEYRLISGGERLGHSLQCATCLMPILVASPNRSRISNGGSASRERTSRVPECVKNRVNSTNRSASTKRRADRASRSDFDLLFYHAKALRLGLSF